MGPLWQDLLNTESPSQSAEQCSREAEIAMGPLWQDLLNTESPSKSAERRSREAQVAGVGPRHT